MGFIPGHTRRSHKDIKVGVRAPDAYEEDAIRCALIGSPFHTGVVSCLLGNLFSSCGFGMLEVLPDLLGARLLEEIL